MLYGGGLLGLAMLLFWIWAILDVITTPDGTQRNLPKVAWVFIVLLFWIVGGFAWVALGRPVASAGARPRLTDPPPRPPRRRQVAEVRDEAVHASEQERLDLERAEYYRRMDEELDRRIEEKRREEAGEAPDEL